LHYRTGGIIMADQFFAGDIGTDIICECGENITGATGTIIKYKKPDGAEGQWVADIYNDPESELTNSTLKYTTKEGDWLEADIGNWDITVFMVLDGWSGHGETDQFELLSVFARR
jgi:hypothetical protein